MNKGIIICLIILVLAIIGVGGYFMLFNNKKSEEKMNNNYQEEEFSMENSNVDMSGKEIVLNRYKEMQQAMCDKDEKTLNEVIKDGTTFTHMSGKTQTKEEYISDIINKRLDYQSYKIEHPEVTIDRNKAIIKARVSLTANAYGAQGTWPFDTTAYFEKIDGKWYYTNQF